MSKKWKKSARDAIGGHTGNHIESQRSESVADPTVKIGGDGNLSKTQLCDVWLKLIARYDFYYGSVNTKAALLIAFNTFVAGGIVIKWQDIEKTFGAQRPIFVIAVIALTVAVISSLVSLFYTFRSVYPTLDSPEIPNKYHSLIFFDAVSQFQAKDYHAEVSKLQDGPLLRDLAFQAHSLAGGLSGKFKQLRTAIMWIQYAQIPSLLAIVLLILIALAADAIPKITS